MQSLWNYFWLAPEKNKDDAHKFINPDINLHKTQSSSSAANKDQFFWIFRSGFMRVFGRRFEN